MKGDRIGSLAMVCLTDCWLVSTIVLCGCHTFNFCLFVLSVHIVTRRLSRGGPNAIGSTIQDPCDGVDPKTDGP